MQECDQKNFPMISVIMGVYNCKDTVSEAIESILNQTYQDFEFVICDDGSTDGTFEIVNEYAGRFPDKIVFVSNEENKGLNFTLNHCLQCAKGKYIARMDGDDLSLSNRFETEVLFLEHHPDIAILGASLRAFDENGVWGLHTFKDYPEGKDFMKGSPFSHSVCMVRHEAYDAVNGYSEGDKLLRVEDYHLWVKMYSKGYRGANLSEELYLYRDDRAGYKKRKFKYRLNQAYVCALAVKLLHLPVWYLVFSVRPILIGVLPARLYEVLHRGKLTKGRRA